jgi:hypothetical protein
MALVYAIPFNTYSEYTTSVLRISMQISTAFMVSAMVMQQLLLQNINFQKREFQITKLYMQFTDTCISYL